jgi:hypothetical protein
MESSAGSEIAVNKGRYRADLVHDEPYPLQNLSADQNLSTIVPISAIQATAANVPINMQSP